MQTASDDYENNKTNTLYAYQAAKIDRDAQKESTTASFRKLYTDLQEKQTALAAADADLAQAKKTFTVSQVQYTRGMISRWRTRMRLTPSPPHRRPRLQRVLIC